MALNAIFKEALQYVPTLVSAVTQNRETGAEKQQRAMIAQRDAILRAAYDPSSEMFKQQYGIESGNIARDWSRTIEELSRQQRRAGTNGRTALLDNERADEILSRLANEGSVDAATRGRQGAQHNLVGMADSMGGAIQDYGNLATSQKERQGARSNMLAQVADKAIGSILDRYGTPKSTAGRTIADIYRDTNAGMGGQNRANQQYEQSSQLLVPRYQRGYA